MKISELIDKLSRALGEHGDIDVVSDSADGCLPVQVEGVRDVVDDDGNEAKAVLMYGLEVVEYEPEQLPPIEPGKLVTESHEGAALPRGLTREGVLADEPDEDAAPTVRYDSNRPPKEEP